MTQPQKPAHLIYLDAVNGGNMKSLAESLWGTIPQTMGEAAAQLPRIREQYEVDMDNLEALKKQMKSQLRQLGVLTNRTASRIDSMHNGVIETGQQPMVLGGPSLILNKIAYTASLAGMTEGMVPLFYVADYDGLQPELVNMWLPSPSPRGLLVSYPTEPGMENMAIHDVPSPSEEWLRETLKRIEENYRGLAKGTPQQAQLFQSELAHVFSILKQSYYSTGNLSTLSTKILGTLLNLESDLGAPIYWFNMKGTRHLFQSGYELLLAEPNRSVFIQASNEAAEKVEAYGYRPQIGLREKGYVPFFLECMKPGCHRMRVELSYVRGSGASTASLKGKCGKCGEVYDFSVDVTNPDISDFVDWVTPRVDSRQVVVDSVIPVVAHVGGPGETSYYAEVIPAVKRLKIPFPIYLRYTRVFYNTKWNEAFSAEMKQEGYPVITSEWLFDALSSWVDGRNSGDPAKLRQAHIDMQEAIESPYNTLLEKLEELNQKVEEIKLRLRHEKDRGPLIREMRTLQTEAGRIELYLSHVYGRFQPERYGQEVSWLWMDLALAAGVKDVMGAYMRVYNEHTPNSSMFFVNT